MRLPCIFMLHCQFWGSSIPNPQVCESTHVVGALTQQQSSAEKGGLSIPMKQTNIYLTVGQNYVFKARNSENVPIFPQADQTSRDWSAAKTTPFNLKESVPPIFRSFWLSDAPFLTTMGLEGNRGPQLLNTDISNISVILEWSQTTDLRDPSKYMNSIKAILNGNHPC